MPVGDGNLHILMLTIHEPATMITTALQTLPAFQRSLVTAHFIDGDSIWKIMRHSNLKRKEIESAIQAALTTMKEVLRSRGIETVSDVV